MKIINTTRNIVADVGRALTHTKKKPEKSKNFIEETPDEYAKRVMDRRNRRY